MNTFCFIIGEDVKDICFYRSFVSSVIFACNGRIIQQQLSRVLACDQALSRGAGGLLAGYTSVYKVSRNVTRKVTDLCSMEQNNRDHETFLSTRTSNNPGETGSTPAFVTCLIALSQCYITATLFVVLIVFYLFFQFPEL